MIIQLQPRREGGEGESNSVNPLRGESKHHLPHASVKIFSIPSGVSAAAAAIANNPAVGDDDPMDGFSAVDRCSNMVSYAI